MMKCTRCISASCLLVFDSDQVSKIERMGGLKFSTGLVLHQLHAYSSKPNSLVHHQIEVSWDFPNFSQFCRDKKRNKLSCQYFSEQLHQPGTDPANHQWVSIHPHKDKQETTRANPTNEQVSNLKSQQVPTKERKQARTNSAKIIISYSPPLLGTILPTTVLTISEYKECVSL